eukprot:1157726-Pelagomonas_calceolata.AAC.6
MDCRAFHGRSCQAASQPHSSKAGLASSSSVRAQALAYRSTIGRRGSVLSDNARIAYTLPHAQHRHHIRSIQLQQSWTPHAGPDLWLPPSSGRGPRGAHMLKISKIFSEAFH